MTPKVNPPGIFMEGREPKIRFKIICARRKALVTICSKLSVTLFIARGNNKRNLTGYREMFEKLCPGARVLRSAVTAVQHCSSVPRGISVIDG